MTLKRTVKEVQFHLEHLHIFTSITPIMANIKVTLSVDQVEEEDMPEPIVSRCIRSIRNKAADCPMWSMWSRPSRKVANLRQIFHRHRPKSRSNWRKRKRNKSCWPANFSDSSIAPFVLWNEPCIRTNRLTFSSTTPAPKKIEMGKRIGAERSILYKLAQPFFSSWPTQGRQAWPCAQFESHLSGWQMDQTSYNHELRLVFPISRTVGGQLR